MLDAGPDTSLPLLYVKDLTNPEVETQDRHHFERVLRVKAGDAISISDGKGSWRKCYFGKELTDLSTIQRHKSDNPAKVSVGFCPLKGGRTDWVIAKLTEVGVGYMTPFFAERSVVRFDEDKIETQTKRWEKIAREAGMQSRRAVLPRIVKPTSFQDLIAGEATESRSSKIARCDVLGRPIEDLEESGIVHLLVGPEGGWSEPEREQVKDAFCLGPHILRSETAAILAGANLVRFSPA